MNVTIFRDYKEENWQSMEVYADTLVKYLKRAHGDTIRIHEYVTLPSVSRFFPTQQKIARHIFRYIIDPLGAALQRADVYHITDHAYAHLLAVLDPRKTIVTCHDLTTPYWTMGHVKSTTKRRIKYGVERWSLDFLKKAARVVAVSESTKRNIIQTLHIEPDKITVIPEGVEKSFHPVRNKTRVRDVILRYRLPRKFILHIGTNYYNKNIEALLSIFFYLAEHDPDICLVKAGEAWTDEQKQIIQSSSWEKRVIHAGFVAQEDLAVLYSLATALVQPSYSEGFGLTVLEAMTCGCPVVVSDVPALREMAGNAGLYIFPRPTKDDLEKIRALISNPRARETQSRLGLARSKNYRWETCARRTYQTYQDVIAENHS